MPQCGCWLLLLLLQVPVEVILPDKMQAVAAGEAHTLALSSEYMQQQQQQQPHASAAADTAGEQQQQVVFKGALLDTWHKHTSTALVPTTLVNI